MKTRAKNALALKVETKILFDQDDPSGAIKKLRQGKLKKKKSE